MDRIVAKDNRYDREAYLLLYEALEHTQKTLNSTGRRSRHVSGQELLEGIRSYLVEHYGCMTLTLLQQWGIRSTEDFGEIVFNLVENNLLSKTDKDTREDFKGGYDFDEVFRRPWLPSSNRRITKPRNDEHHA